MPTTPAQPNQGIEETFSDMTSQDQNLAVVPTVPNNTELMQASTAGLPMQPLTQEEIRPAPRTLIEETQRVNEHCQTMLTKVEHNRLAAVLCASSRVTLMEMLRDLTTLADKLSVASVLTQHQLNELDNAIAEQRMIEQQQHYRYPTTVDRAQYLGPAQAQHPSSIGKMRQENAKEIRAIMTDVANAITEYNRKVREIRVWRNSSLIGGFLMSLAGLPKPAKLPQELKLSELMKTD
jgi:hypothetical protein